MKTADKRSQEYLKSAVMSASGEQLQLMLIDGAIRFSHRALEALGENDIEKSHFALERAQRIVLQLAAGQSLSRTSLFLQRFGHRSFC